MIGWDGGRLAMMLAVLDSRAGMRLSAQDVYLNVAGGLRVSEPAADLAVAAALCSAATETPTDAGTVYFGEVGLSGEIRQVAQADARLKEAQKLGFAAASMPRRLAQGGRKPVALPGLAAERDGASGGTGGGVFGKEVTVRSLVGWDALGHPATLARTLRGLVGCPSASHPTGA